MANIYWKDIKSSQKVKENRGGWTIGRNLVFWHGQEAGKAQTWLRKRALKDSKK